MADAEKPEPSKWLHAPCGGYVLPHCDAKGCRWRACHWCRVAWPEGGKRVMKMRYPIHRQMLPPLDES